MKYKNSEYLPMKKILTQKQYELFVMVNEFKLPLKEIASILNINENKVIDLYTQCLLRIAGYNERENG